MFCMECGAKLPDNAKFCFQCGTKVGQAGETAPAAEAPKTARGCTPGKKYPVKRMDYKSEDFEGMPETEIKKNDIYLWYTKLDDGTVVCWVYGHTKKSWDTYGKNIPRYYYNLYRWDTDGTATFLNAGGRNGIEGMYVKDGYAYWQTYDIWYRTSIYDEEPAEKLEKAPE